MSGVNFDQVTKRFGESTAVDRLSLEVKDREFMVLLGPSGCGKTTALRMIAGLDTVTSGTLSIGGTVVNDLAASDRDIAMVFQSYALYPHMTVRRNIESPLRANKRVRVDAGEVARRVAEATEILGLGPYLDRKPGALSGGQRQRVALARAIVRRPEVFLMDEPLSNLDAKLRTQTRLELVELWRRLATTFIYVTHDQVEAMTMGSRIAVMSEGRLQQVGEPQAVYERPANLFVAAFIGSPPMNLLAGTLQGANAVHTVAGTVAVAHPIGMAGGAAVTVGIRPEDVRIATIHDVQTAGVTSTVTATVLNVELLGHERHVIAVVGDARWVIRQTDGDPVVDVGQAVTLVVDPSAVHVFDSSTTERLN
ncbi:MAG: ABC transporter ATP-binding protein [Microthrixaceae bacterium]